MCAAEQVVCGMWVRFTVESGREGRCGVPRRLYAGIILGWDFHWLGVGRRCDVPLRGGRARKGRPWGRVDVLVCHGCAAGSVSALCQCVFALSLPRSVAV